jgi:hypothetical protein
MIKKIERISGKRRKNSFGSAGKEKFLNVVNTQIIWKLSKWFPEGKFNFNEFFMTVEIEVCKGKGRK